MFVYGVVDVPLTGQIINNLRHFLLGDAVSVEFEQVQLGQTFGGWTILDACKDFLHVWIPWL